MKLSISVFFLVGFFTLSAQGADRVVADYGGVSGFQITTWVAKDLKIFDKYGLDVELIMITGGARSVATLLSRSTQFATGSATTPLLAQARGSDIVFLAASYNKFPYSIVSHPSIRSPNDLRGKRVGILNFGGSNDLALQLALTEWSLKRQDLNIIIGGDAATRLLSLTTGRIDATILSPPHLTVAMKSGYRVLADMGEMRADFPQSTLYVRRGFLREQRDLTKRFVKAYSEAIHVLKNDRGSSLKVFAKRMRLEDPEILNATYAYYAPRFSFPPRVSMPGIKDTLEFYTERNPDIKVRSPQDFVDHSILEELEREGFFKGMDR